MKRLIIAILFSLSLVSIAYPQTQFAPVYGMFPTAGIANTIWGSGSGFTWTFNAGATDPTITFGSGVMSFGSANITFGDIAASNMGATNGIIAKLSSTNLSATNGIIGEIAGSNMAATNAVITTGTITTFSAGSINAGAGNYAPISFKSPIVFSQLGGTNRIIDLSAANLGGASNYWIYGNSTNYWMATGGISASNLGATNGTITNLSSTEFAATNGIAGANARFSGEISMGSLNSAAGNAAYITLNSPITFGNLGTATRGIDLSGSGLTGTDYWIYLGSGNYWGSDGTLVAMGSIMSPYLRLTTDGFIYANSNINIMADIDNSAHNINAAVVLGEVDKIGSLAACNAKNSATIEKAAHGLTLATGVMVHVTGATTASNKGFYRYVSGSANTIVVDRSLTGTDSDVALTAYKDVISIHATDGTSGQMLTSWSNQNKPLQLGGTTLQTSAGLNSTDIVIGGKLNIVGSGGAGNHYVCADAGGNIYTAAGNCR